MKNRVLLACGLLVSPLYVGTILLGGALTPGYSHLMSSISDLTALGAPQRMLLDGLFVVDYGLLGLFAVGVLQVARSDRRGRNNGLTCAAALLSAAIFGSLLQVFFPQDAGGLRSLMTPVGALHLIVATVAALSAAFSTLFSGLWFSDRGGMKRYSVYSLATFALMIFTGGVDLLAAFIWFPYFGLIERTTLGAFVVWTFLVALKLMARTEAA